MASRQGRSYLAFVSAVLRDSIVHTAFTPRFEREHNDQPTCQQLSASAAAAGCEDALPMITRSPVADWNRRKPLQNMTWRRGVSRSCDRETDSAATLTDTSRLALSPIWAALDPPPWAGGGDTGVSSVDLSASPFATPSTGCADVTQRGLVDVTIDKSEVLADTSWV